MPIPTLIVAGTHSGAGKTTVTLALMAALARRGLQVQGFKVGPDFIDPGHHGRITGRKSRNLDTWLLEPDRLAETFRRGVKGADIAIVEGAMGLFDGRGACDEAGSAADLARRWDLPVALVVDARGLARSIAPMVLGFANFDPTVRVAGVIANGVGSHRHYSEYLAPSLASAAPSIARAGYLQQNEALVMSSRHLGLVTAEESPEVGPFLTALAKAGEATIDIDRLLEIARPPRLPDKTTPDKAAPATKRVAQALDRAFCFYYEDNLDALRDAGAEIVPFSPLDDDDLPPDIDLVYLGGGYPELFAERIAANGRMRDAIRRFHADGGAIYAECGGLMVCVQALRDGAGKEHAMWGLVPATVVMRPNLTALGYVTAVAERDALVGPRGTSIRGHEFHYSELESTAGLRFATTLHRPDRPAKPDGIEVGGLLAGYAHLHFGSNPAVASSLLAGRGATMFAHG